MEWSCAKNGLIRRNPNLIVVLAKRTRPCCPEATFAPQSCHSFLPTWQDSFHVTICLWQSSGKVKKMSLEALRGLLILVAFKFDLVAVCVTSCHVACSTSLTHLLQFVADRKSAQMSRLRESICSCQSICSVLS